LTFGGLVERRGVLDALDLRWRQTAAFTSAKLRQAALGKVLERLGQLRLGGSVRDVLQTNDAAICGNDAVGTEGSVALAKTVLPALVR